MQNSKPDTKRGYKRFSDRSPQLSKHVKHFKEWNKAVKIWLKWIEQNIPKNEHISKKEALDDFYVTSLGLKVFERIKVDIYPDPDVQRKNSRTEYDARKLLRAVVLFPAIAALKGKRTKRKNENITTIFKEIIGDAIKGKAFT